MASQLLSAGVFVEEEPPSIRTVQAVPTADTAFVGITERGPFEPTLVNSFAEFQRIFGGFTADSDLALAIQGFFTNGGQVAWIQRTVHFTDITDKATKTSAVGTLNLQTAASAASAGTVVGTGVAPFDLEPGEQLTIDVDAGGPVVATFDAAAAERTAANAPTYALADGQDLTVSIDGGPVQTIIFNTAEFVDIANATGAEVIAVINAEIVGAFADLDGGNPRITSDKRGTDSGVNVTGGTANAALGFTTGNIAGTGDVADIDAVTGLEAKTVIEADVAGVTVSSEIGGQLRITSNTTGPASSVQVTGASTAADFGFDNATHSGTSGAPVNTLQVDGKTDGSYANLLRPIVDPATSGTATEFNLLIEDDGVIAEIFPNVTMDPLLPNYVETLVNANSNLVTVTDLLSGAADPRPAEGTFGPLAGGDDGLVGLDDNDFIGSDAGQTGIRGFDQIQGLALLAIPARATSGVHNAMLTYCEVTREGEMFAILDIPEGQTAQQAVVYVESTAAILNFSEYGAIYWPRIQIVNPSKTIFGNDDNIVVAPSGHIAGVYARTDSSLLGGVYRAPAGPERGRIAGMVGFETDETKDKRKRDLVYPKRINPITVTPGQPRHIDGSRTLKGNGNFPSIPERRGVIFIESSLKNGLQFLKHDQNTPKTRRDANRTVTAFLLAQLRNGAFADPDPAKAFFVDTSTELNTPTVVAAGQLIIRIGLAPAVPAEFIIIRVTKDTRAIDEELAAASA